MTEERLKVLAILQEGKINAEDAARLLEALNKTPVDDGDDEGAKVKVKVKILRDDDEDIEARIDEDIDAQVDRDVKMKIKVKTHHDGDE
jgi:hypothetical protein